MQDALPIGLKAIAGGVFVVLFAAAPAVALASLLLTSVTRGPSATLPLTTAMVFGSAGMITYCAVSLFTIERYQAAVGSISAWAVWIVVTVGLYRVFGR